MLLIISFLCLMTGLFSPDIVIKWGIPNFKYRKITFILASGVTLTGSMIYTMGFDASQPEESQIVSLDITSTDTDVNHPSDEKKEMDGVMIELLEIKVSEQASTLFIDLAIENRSDEPISYNPYQFLVETTSGKQFVPSIYVTEERMLLGAGELNPGDKIEGSLTYSILSDEVPASLRYLPATSSPSQNLIFDLTLEKTILTDSAKSDEVSLAKTAAIGEVIKEEGIEYQVLEANRLDQLGNHTPKVGHDFLKVQLAIKNISNDNLLIFPYHFEVSYGKQSKLKPVTSLIDQENLLSLSELVSGGIILTDIVFEVPKSSSNLTLTYSNPLRFQSKLKAVNLDTKGQTENLLTPSIDLGDDWIVGSHLIPSVLEGMELTTYSYELKDETLYTKSRIGKQFVLIDVSLKNKVEQKRRYTAFDFKLLTSNGQLLMPSLMLIDNQSEFKSGELAFEEETTGILLFEVEQGDASYSLVYSPSNWENSERIIIPLS